MTHKNGYELQRIAERYLTLGIQEWGQSEQERGKAAEAYLLAAGRPGDTTWLAALLVGMPWGKFERERDYLLAKLKEAQPSEH